ncbi:MAG: L,D-transpeptidase [Acidobacteria bacterium]|nr:L,D-transpeptidase [Acidobacteriota bacterium]
MPLITVTLQRDRTKTGTLTVTSAAGATLAGPFDALCKADNAAAAARGNPSRDPTKSYGDTPTGKYRGFVSALARTPVNDRTYGPQSVITLDPVSGQAKTAKENGRWGLLIHGGALNAAGKLRPTFGCVRVSNTSMQILLGKLPGGEKIEVVVSES